MQPEIEQFLQDREFTLTIKGIGAFPLNRVSKASGVLFAKLDYDRHFETLVELTNMIIKRMLVEKVLFENELGHIEYDEQNDRYLVKFHLTLINSTHKLIDGNRAGFVGIPLLKRFGEEQFGSFKPNKICLYKRKIQNGVYLSELDINIDANSS